MSLISVLQPKEEDDNSVCASPRSSGSDDHVDETSCCSINGSSELVEDGHNLKFVDLVEMTVMIMRVTKLNRGKTIHNWKTIHSSSSGFSLLLASRSNPKLRGLKVDNAWCHSRRLFSVSSSVVDLELGGNDHPFEAGLYFAKLGIRTRRRTASKSTPENVIVGQLLEKM
ncbi:uncharacterized protein LOC133718829 [Rosa rugosa]|uniref:uncharacterized protein LOC133718829 n=1 Tax=Rosa rugosa TaxID=74645 RepID=UPI002B408ADE|nr:uncharacterized protein LOC133718829 [Rosa rugosa]XP_062001693.1 uncharacterized protein LOC133718829 [Rosa rugosa]